MAGGNRLASYGPRTADGVRLPIGTGDELRLTPEHQLTYEEMGLARAVANTLATALQRLRDEERMRHDAVHDPLTGLANRILAAKRFQDRYSRTASARRNQSRDNRIVGVIFGAQQNHVALRRPIGRLRKLSFLPEHCLLHVLSGLNLNERGGVGDAAVSLCQH